MQKLKWILPVLAGVFVTIAFAQKAQAGVATAICTSGDSLEVSDSLHRSGSPFYYAGFSIFGLQSSRMTEEQAKGAALRKCREDRCTRCDLVCSGEGSLYQFLSEGHQNGRLIAGCSIVSAAPGMEQEDANERYVDVTASRAIEQCNQKLRSSGGRGGECGPAVDDPMYHSDPLNRPFVVHYY